MKKNDGGKFVPVVTHKFIDTVPDRHHAQSKPGFHLVRFKLLSCRTVCDEREERPNHETRVCPGA